MFIYSFSLSTSHFCLGILLLCISLSQLPSFLTLLFFLFCFNATHLKRIFMSSISIFCRIHSNYYYYYGLFVVRHSVVYFVTSVNLTTLVLLTRESWVSPAFTKGGLFTKCMHVDNGQITATAIITATLFR
ncbi:unnamed protein product [Trichobilharzia szidati]|nr:unnamed protein product [Trichobilharzia szidati]